MCIAAIAGAQPIGTITTVAGGATGDGGPAVNIPLQHPASVALDAAGNVNFSGEHRIRKVSPQGIISTVAGTGAPGFTADGALAVGALLDEPRGIAFDASGNLYFADSRNNRVRKVDANGSITTVAGNGTAGFSGDGGAATSAALNRPTCLAFDSLGRLLICDAHNNRIRRIEGGTILTVAGSGQSGAFNGDGIPAPQATLSLVLGIASDGAGGFFFSDYMQWRVRHVGADGIVRTVVSASRPDGLDRDAAGNLFICESQANRILRLQAGGVLEHFAGTGAAGASGDGGPALQAALTCGEGLAVDGADVYFADPTSGRIRKIDASTTVRTIAGTGEPYSRDGLQAEAAVIFGPTQVLSDPAGGLLFFEGRDLLEAHADHVRRIDAGGVLTTVTPWSQTNGVMGFAKDVAGNRYLSSGNDTVIFKIDVAGAMTWFAGTSAGGFGGDGGPATRALLRRPSHFLLDASGNLFFIDASVRVRRVDADGLIWTVAGNGRAASDGDGGPATAAAIEATSIAFDGAGNLYIGGNALRKVDAAEIISTIPGTTGFRQVAADHSGNVYGLDAASHVVRRLDPLGVVSTIAGTDTAGYSGDGGPAMSAMLHK